MLAVIGDIHLNKLTHHIPDFNDLVLKTFRSTVQKAIDRGADAIALVGDIFNDPYPDQDSQIAFLDACTDFDIEFLAILGNHDFADITRDSLRITKWTKKLKSNIRVIDKPLLKSIGGVKYQFLPHPYVQDMSRKADYGLAHFAVNGAQGDNGFKVKTKNAPKGNWVLGDFHTEQQGKIKGCIYDYVGSLSQLSWEEKPKKSFITIEDGEKVRHKIDLSYKLIKYVVSSDEELEALKFEKDSFYFLRTKHGYVLPRGWTLNHPEVIRQSAIGAQKDKRAALLAPNEVFVHPLANLENYLLTRKHVPETVARAVELANAIKV